MPKSKTTPSSAATFFEEAAPPRDADGFGNILRWAMDDAGLRRQQYTYRRRPACFCDVSDAGKMPAVQRIPSPIYTVERRSECNLENLRCEDQTRKVRPIEEEFQRLMFEAGES